MMGRVLERDNLEASSGIPDALASISIRVGHVRQRHGKYAIDLLVIGRQDDFRSQTGNDRSHSVAGDGVVAPQIAERSDMPSLHTGLFLSLAQCSVKGRFVGTVAPAAGE